MPKRPTLSLKRKLSSNVEPDVSKAEKEKPPFDPVAFEKKAIKERVRRYHAALNLVKSLNLPMPLSKGIGRTLVVKLRDQGVSRKAFSWAMQKWTHSDVYLNAVINGKCRFNLDGTSAELITDAEREYSRSILVERNLKK